MRQGEIASKMAVNMLEEYSLSSESDPAKRLREAFTGINGCDLSPFHER